LKVIFERQLMSFFYLGDQKSFSVYINAKAEGIENKPACREAFQRRRCLVPVDSFYEWKKTATGKQPYAIRAGRPGRMALAGDRPTGRPAYGFRYLTRDLMLLQVRA
jgi:putative SOS response-associated peptidase YedK